VAALTGIAQVHAIWYGREQELVSQGWIGPAMTAEKMADMSDLWTALADFASPHFSQWTGADYLSLANRLISSVQQWWKPLEQMPRTLIHNDFNPRNIAFREGDGSLRLCAYDWELASLAVPQRDLAELLCFVLPRSFSMDTVRHYVDVHRRALQRATGASIEADSWELGFQRSLYDLILNRFPMYCLMHTFRRQPFLETVIRNWSRLIDAVRKPASSDIEAYR
jgi:hypothetical protein